MDAQDCPSLSGLSMCDKYPYIMGWLLRPVLFLFVDLRESLPFAILDFFFCRPTIFFFGKIYKFYLYFW